MASSRSVGPNEMESGRVGRESRERPCRAGYRVFWVTPGSLKWGRNLRRTARPLFGPTLLKRGSEFARFPYPAAARGPGRMARAQRAGVLPPVRPVLGCGYGAVVSVRT